MSTESEFRQENNYEEDNSRQYKKKKKHKRASCDLDDKDEIPHKERRKEKHKHSSYGDEKRHGESSRHEKDSDSHRESEQKHKHKKHKHERDRDDRRRSDDQHETKQQEDTKRDSKKEIDDMFLGVNKRKEAVKDSEEAAPSAPKTESAARADMGQWGSAQFENANVQNKFFKLLGGFKKKSSGETSNVNKAAKTQLITGNKVEYNPGFRLALDSSKQNQLQDALEEQFEKARENVFKKKKKGGLGFVPDEEEEATKNKKFHIDITKSESKKFDDEPKV